MEQNELSSQVVTITERIQHLGTKDDLNTLKTDLLSLESDLKNQIGKVDRDLNEMGIRFDNRFDNLETLIRTNALAAENKLLKKIIGWGLGVFGVIFSGLIVLLVNS